MTHNQLNGWGSLVKQSQTAEPRNDWNTHSCDFEVSWAQYLPSMGSNPNSDAYASHKTDPFLNLPELCNMMLEEHLLHKVTVRNKWSNKYELLSTA